MRVRVAVMIEILDLSTNLKAMAHRANEVLMERRSLSSDEEI